MVGNNKCFFCLCVCVHVRESESLERPYSQGVTIGACMF